MPTAWRNSLQSFTSCSMIKCGMCWTQQDLDYLECSILPVPMLPIALLKFPLFFGANMVVGNRPCSRPHGDFSEPPNELLNRITIRLTPRPSVQSLATDISVTWRSVTLWGPDSQGENFSKLRRQIETNGCTFFQRLDQNPSLLDLYLQYGIKLIQIIWINLIYHEA